MKNMKTIVAFALAGILCAGLLESSAAEKEQAKLKPYPLETCLVTNEKLGSMGKPYVMAHEGQEIKLCCKGCEKSFKKEPAKFMRKLDDARKKKSK